MAQRGQLGILGQRQVAPGGVAGGAQRAHLEAFAERRQVGDLQRRPDQSLQLAQGGILAVPRLDFLGLGQVEAGLGLQGVGAGAVAALELALVELELLAVGAFLRPRQFDLVLGQQRAGIGFRTRTSSSWLWLRKRSSDSSAWATPLR